MNNELRRDVARFRQELTGLKADMEQDGHISESIGNLSEDADRLERKVDKIYERSHQINQSAGRQEVMLQMLTRIYDLPEE